jgi:hypothetical protein
LAHERQLLRDAVVAQLIGPTPYVRTAAGPRVFRTRNGPVRETDLPCLCVFVSSETVDASNQWAPLRTGTLTIEAYVKAAPTADLDAALDDLALQVETAMDLDPYLASSARTSALAKTTLETSMLGAQPMGRAALEYTCDYETPFRGPPAADDFHTADIRTSLGGTQATADQSHDVVTLP